MLQTIWFIIFYKYFTFASGNKKSRYKTDSFSLVKHFFSNVKSTGKKQTKNNKKNKFAIPVLFDPKTTNQF